MQDNQSEIAAIQAELARRQEVNAIQSELARRQSTIQPAQPDNVLRETSPQEQAPPKTWQDYVYQFANPFANLARRTTAGAATIGRDIANIPHMIYGGIPEVAPQADYYKTLGIEQGLGDVLARELASYVGAGGALKAGAKGLQMIKSPEVANLVQKAGQFLTKTPGRQALAENVGTGALLGAYQAPEGEKLRSAATGGALGAVATGAGKLAEKAIIQPAANIYARSAIPGLIEKATDKLKALASPEEYTQALKATYGEAAAKNAKNWMATGNKAAVLDQQLANVRQFYNPTASFQPSAYEGYITDFLNNVKTMEPAKAEQYQQAVAFAQHALDLSPKSFEGAVALRQNINQSWKRFMKEKGMTQTEHHTTELIKGLKQSIQDSVEQNKTFLNPKDFESFKNTWNEANKSHAALQEFKQAPNKAGELKFNRALKSGMTKQGEADAAILGEFLPKSTQTGIEGYKQLSKLFGSKEKMQEAAKSYYLRRLKTDGSYGKDIVDLYGRLSPQQRGYLFGKDEQSILDTANKAILKVGRPSETKLHPSIRHGLGYGLPGAAGTGLAMSMGMPWDEAVLYGGIPATLGFKGAQKGLGKIAASNPQLVLRALARAGQNAPNRGRLTNIALQSLMGGQQ